MSLSAATKNFLSKNKCLLINGKWVSAVSGRTFDTINPADGTRLTSVAHGQEADINLAVKAAREAFENGPWRKMSPSERGKMLHRVGDLILKHAEELSQLEALDNGKPVVVAKIADVGLSADIFHYMSGWTTKIHGRTFPNSVAGLIAPASARFLTSTLKEPIGVIGQVIPWNFPLLMAAWKLAPALACGNVSVLKPAEQTPLTALRLGEILQEAGIPDGVVNIVTGHGDAGAAIAAHPGIDKIAFTGSTEVGRLIVKAAAGNLKKVTLELGGKSPNVVFKDAKNAPGGMEAAIAGAASSIFFNQGQTCCAGSRLMVEQEVFDEVIEGVSKIANSIKIGHGIDPTTQLGPLVSSEQFDRVRGYMTQGKQDGACFNAGGLDKPHGDAQKGYFVRPTVISKVKSSMSIVREEIFGPVVVAESFKNYDDLVKSANNSEYGLAAGVFTSDISKAHRLASDIRAGTVWVNCYNVFDAALPFGGYKQSGWGREMGPEVLDAYTETKALCISI